jgi:hypothetical protein
MLKIIKYHTIFLLSAVLCSTQLFAQSGFFIPQSGSIFFIGDSATIFSNVLNKGNLGLGKKAVLNFTGAIWENDPLSLITDEANNGKGVSGSGGMVSFSGKGIRQQLIGGYNAASRKGPIFSSLQVQNTLGIELSASSAKVWQNLVLDKGKIFLNDKIFIVGNGQPGNIIGFDSSRFFITGTQANGGILLRENIRNSDGLVIFPVGTSANAYTPAAIQSRTAMGDDYYVSVFDGARSGVFNGTMLKQESVNKTWQIGKTQHPGEDDADIYLQHLTADEGNLFAFNRQYAYVSRFSGGQWDEGLPQSLPLPGTLNNGALLNNSGLNKRTFHDGIAGPSYFTKLTGLRDTLLKTKLVLGAYRVDSRIVKVNWQTNPEIDVKYFVVERRLSNEANFSSVDTVLSQAINGVSFTTLFYSINDSNNYKGISFYRLKIFDYSGSGYYSYIVAVNGAGFNTVLLWPNPTPGPFSLIINSPEARSVVIFNVLGQQLWSKNLAAGVQTYIQVDDIGLIPGAYFVTLFDKQGTILHTEKLIIAGK